MTSEVEGRCAYVTFEIADQIFGIEIARVREVFRPDRITRVPLASAEVAGVLNLRGRVVTAIDMRVMLGLPPQQAGAMAIGVDRHSESFALLVDRPGDVVELDRSLEETAPQSLDRNWARLVGGVHRLDDRLLLILDIDQILVGDDDAVAA